MRGRSASLLLGAALLALVVAAPAPGAAPARVEHLQHLGKKSYFAFVDHAMSARTRPDASAPAVAQLTTRSPVATDDLVLVLARTKDAAGHAWLQVRLPVRPNGTTGWVRASALGPLQPVRTWLKIDTRRFRATLIKNGKVVWRARVGVGTRLRTGRPSTARVSPSARRTRAAGAAGVGRGSALMLRPAQSARRPAGAPTLLEG